MKAKEVLRRYATGERDFRGANLCGQNFSEKDLSGANFSHANIRATNFNKAILRGTDFTGAKAGIQRYLITGLLIAASILSIFSVAVAAGYWSSCNGEGIFFSCSIYIFRTSDIFTALFEISLGIYGICYLIKIPVRYIFISAVFSTGISIFIATHALSINLISISGFTSYFALAMHVSIPIGIVLSLYFFLLYYLLFIKLEIYLANLLPEDSIWRKSIELDIRNNQSAHRIITFFFGRFCTSFRGSNLIGANFTRADISHTNFRRADLRNVLWYQSQNINLAGFGNITSANSQIQQLLTTLQGADQDFSQLDLSGINLQGADLQGANFMSANLSTTNLQDSDLSGTNLKQAQLDSADLIGATLTDVLVVCQSYIEG
jgi:uncharacterized protein YjbI with pentapeptide repeats